MTSRRSIIAIAAGLTLLIAHHPIARAVGDVPSLETGNSNTFGFSDIKEFAHRLSQKKFSAVASIPDRDVRAQGYENYRTFKFLPTQSRRRTFVSAFEIEPLPAGWIYRTPVEVSVLEQRKPVELRAQEFDFRYDNSPLGADKDAPFSGFRIKGHLNTISKLDEIIVFQGASYFRALGRGHQYGLSARALAINTETGRDEEFPSFRKFWVNKPDVRSNQITIFALLDSESITGAYKFTVAPGDETVVNVEMTLFPRRSIASIGLAPLTSMNFLSPAQINTGHDFRPRIHDSNGLAIHNSKNERIWRPLINPDNLQLSYFRDTQISAFGLVQRNRKFSDYQDLEALYHKRPTTWIEPEAGFDRGDVVLVEIPSKQEVHDNIVAYWRPNKPLTIGTPVQFEYRMRWRDDTPTKRLGPWVSQTRLGKMADKGRPTYRFVIDYTDINPFPDDMDALPKAVATTSHGVVTNVTVQRNPETHGIRVSVLFNPMGQRSADLRLDLGPWSGRVPEVWVYRWVKRS